MESSGKGSGPSNCFGCGLGQTRFTSYNAFYPQTMPVKKVQKQAKMGEFFQPLPSSQANQTLLTKFFKSSNVEDNKYQYLFEREEARRKKIEQEEKEKLEKLKQEEKKRKQEIRRKAKEAKKEQFEVDQHIRWEEEKLKHVGKQIIPGLYVGSRLAAKNLDWINGHVTAILNVSQEVKNYFEGRFVSHVHPNQTLPSDVPVLLNYKRITCQDATDQNLVQFFEESLSFIEEIINQNGAVLVHCREGLSRSPSTIIAFLMKKCEWSLEKAYHHVLDCNRKLRINDGFKRQLMDYEFSIFNAKSIDFFDKRSRAGTSRTSNNRKIKSKVQDPNDKISLDENLLGEAKTDTVPILAESDNGEAVAMDSLSIVENSSSTQTFVCNDEICKMDLS